MTGLDCFAFNGARRDSRQLFVNFLANYRSYLLSTKKTILAIHQLQDIDTYIYIDTSQMWLAEFAPSHST